MLNIFPVQLLLSLELCRNLRIFKIFLYVFCNVCCFSFTVTGNNFENISHFQRNLFKTDKCLS